MRGCLLTITANSEAVCGWAGVFKEVEDGLSQVHCGPE